MTIDYGGMQRSRVRTATVIVVRRLGIDQVLYKIMETAQSGIIKGDSIRSRRANTHGLYPMMVDVV
jgi:hypothetical protein